MLFLPFLLLLICEYIQICFRFNTILHIDLAFVDQGFEPVVQAAHADGQFLGPLAPGQVAIGL